MLKRLLMASVCAAGLLPPIAGYADDAYDLLQEGRRTDRLATSASGSTAVDRIAADFPGTFGTPEQTRKLVTGLRDGTLKGKSHGTMGYGEIYIALALTQAYAASKSLSTDSAMSEILSQRIDGKGWGKIALDLGLNLGQIVSRLRSGNERLAAAFERPAAKGGDRAPQAERVARPERPVRPERAGRN